MGPEWIRCASCGLSHRLRKSGSCPRCGAPTEPRPIIAEAPSPGPMPRAEAVSGAVIDPALCPPPLPRPARLRWPAALAGVAALAVTAAAFVTEAAPAFAGAGAVLASAAFLIAVLARA